MEYIETSRLSRSAALDGIGERADRVRKLRKPARVSGSGDRRGGGDVVLQVGDGALPPRRRRPLADR
jgi:hypothetical protein